MPLKLNSSGGGSVTLDVPVTASAFNVIVPANAGTLVTTGSTAAVTQGMLAAGVTGNGPAFSAFRFANQTISSQVYTKVLLSNEEFDTNNAFDTTNSRFQPSVAGYYYISASVEIGANNDISLFGIFKNGSEIKRYAHLTINPGPTWATFTFNGSAVIYMNGSSDFLELYAYMRTVSGTPTIVGGSSVTYMSGVLVRAA